MASLLVADADPSLSATVASLLKDLQGVQIRQASSHAAALAAARNGSVDVVLASADLLDGEAGDLVRLLSERKPVVPVIVLTGAGQARQTLDALNRGAAAYVARENLQRELREVVGEVVTSARIERRHRHVMACLKENRSHFVLANDLDLIPALVEHLDKDLAELGLFDAATRMRIGVALQEALVNAMVHGNLEINSDVRADSSSRYLLLAQTRRHEPPYRDRRVHVLTHETQSFAAYIIRDAGPGFDPDAVPDCTDPANLDRPCGRGLLLIRSFMDEVRFNDKGNELTMVVRRPPAASGDGDAGPACE